MKRHGLMETPILAFFSKDLYRDVAENWKGIGLPYLLFVLALCWIPFTLSAHIGINRFVEQQGPAVIEQIPTITISQGQVSIAAEVPYFIKDPKKGTPLAILDPGGTIESLDNSTAMLLLTRTKLMFKKDKRETRVYDLSSVKQFTLTREDAQKWLTVVAKWLMIALFPLIVAFSLIYRLLQALLYGWIGSTFAKNLNAPLPYKTLVRLAIVAVTPAILLDTLLDLAHVQSPVWSLVCFGISMGYLLFGIKANVAARQQPV